MKKHIILLSAALMLIGTAPRTSAQELINWHQKDLASDSLYGVSSLRAQELLKDRNASKVVVAIIDSGVDTDHEDLKDNLWVNTGEIPENGKDDDGNGYVDDIHGWNFLGNAEGVNMDAANLEMTRIYRKLAPKFQEVESKKEVDRADRDDYELFKKVEAEIMEKLNNTANEFSQIQGFRTVFMAADSAAKAELGAEYALEDVQSWEPEAEESKLYQNILSGVMQDPSFTPESLNKYYDYLKDQLDHHLNPQFVDRAVLGDDPDDLENRFYGNNNVWAPHNDHGTHVAAIVGAVTGNGIGIDGIAPSVELMILRAVPNGDEFDKDIANAIRYAADNGADIINMSFGKGYSPHVEEVHRAIRYAEEKDVLMVHAAGNEAENIDKVPNFPNPDYGFQRKDCQTWLTVGASSPNGGEDLPGIFSNYGKRSVDVFAPGVQIYSAKPDDTYAYEDGTSMAAPVTSGVAALILSYFPELSAAQLRDILYKTVVDHRKLRVWMPDKEYSPTEQTKFKKLSRSGGVVNAYNAAQRAIQLYGD